jgi:hypothetical protein
MLAGMLLSGRAEDPDGPENAIWSGGDVGTDGFPLLNDDNAPVSATKRIDVAIPIKSTTRRALVATTERIRVITTKSRSATVCP